MAYIPYGYKIQDGVVTVDEKAAGQVKVFFEKYISGLSLTVAGEQAGKITSILISSTNGLNAPFKSRDS